MSKQCKDCVHYEVCYELTYHEPNGEIVGREVCQYFKDKSRFVELPCELGKRVYKLVAKWESHFGCAHCLDGYGMDCICEYYDVQKNECTNIKNRGEDYEIISVRFSLDLINEFGKTVFFTREEAEKALKERESKCK